MNQRQSKTGIDDLVFKPLILHAIDGDRLIIIYAYDNTVEQVANARGGISKKSVDTIKLIDITRSVALNKLVLETHIVNSRKKFRASTEVTTVPHNIEYVTAAMALLAEEVIEAQNKQKELNNLLHAVKRAATVTLQESLEEHEEDSEQQEDGNIILSGSSEPLAHIVFNTVDGQQLDLRKTLKQEDVRKISQVLLETVISHKDADVEDQEFLRKLRAELEYKIIDALPTNLKAGQISLNIDGFISEIKRFREHDDNGNNMELNDE